MSRSADSCRHKPVIRDKGPNPGSIKDSESRGRPGRARSDRRMWGRSVGEAPPGSVQWVIRGDTSELNVIGGAQPHQCTEAKRLSPADTLQAPRRLISHMGTMAPNRRHPDALIATAFPIIDEEPCGGMAGIQVRWSDRPETGAPLCHTGERARFRGHALVPDVDYLFSVVIGGHRPPSSSSPFPPSNPPLSDYLRFVSRWAIFLWSCPIPRGGSARRPSARVRRGRRRRCTRAGLPGRRSRRSRCPP